MVLRSGPVHTARHPVSRVNTVRHRFRAMRVPSFPSAQLLVFWGGQQSGFNGFSHNPVDYATSVDCPALFMHGRDDPRATLDEGRRVFNAVPGPKQFKIFDRTGHESYISTHASMGSSTVFRPVSALSSEYRESLARNNCQNGCTPAEARIWLIHPDSEDTGDYSTKAPPNTGVCSATGNTARLSWHPSHKAYRSRPIRSRPGWGSPARTVRTAHCTHILSGAFLGYWPAP